MTEMSGAAQAVACPTCNAAPGEPCTGEAWKATPADWIHLERFKTAFKKREA